MAKDTAKQDLKAELELGGGKKLPERSEIPEKYKWKLSDIYADDGAWEREYDTLKARSGEIAKFAGRLCESASTVYDCFKLRDELSITLGKLYVYANMKSHVDTSVSLYQGLAAKISALAAQMSAEASFITPELLAVSGETLEEFANSPLLCEYRFPLREIIRQKKHVLSKEEEALLARSSEIADAPENIFSMLTNADMEFRPITDEKGAKVEMSEERAVAYLRSPKREVRKAAFKSLYEPYGKMRNTLGASFGGMLKAARFYAEARKYGSALEAALDGDNIPAGVYHNLVDTIESNLEPLHRYMELRKKVLRVKELHMYDIYVPLTTDPFKKIPWSKAKEMMYEALAPLGGQYIEQVKAGIGGGWADVFSNKGKRGGAYSWGTYATHPYIFMNYTNNLNDVSTLVHETGHSMHSFLSRKNQPYATSDYCIFTAEVASTTNEALLLEHLLKDADRKERLFLLGRRLENIRTTVYRQTMFASFERTVHERASVNGDTTPDALEALWKELNEKYYGPAMNVDRELYMEWARIPHFYTPFYVYQYATGYSAAAALANGILEGGEDARDRYLAFLSAGGSDYPIELLKRAGVDMSSSEPVENVVSLFSDTLAEMEALLYGKKKTERARKK